MVLRLIPRSPRRRIRLVTVAGGLKAQSNPVEPDFASASLTPATGARTTRLHRTQKAPIILRAADRSRGSSRPAIATCAPDALASTASHPASVTIAIRPSVGRDDENSKCDLGQTGTEIFFGKSEKRLDSPAARRANHHTAVILFTPHKRGAYPAVRCFIP